MSRIEVQPEALRDLGGRVIEQVNQAGGAVGGTATAVNGTATGVGALDAALDRFVGRWQAQLVDLGSEGRSLGSGISAVAGNYRQTDRTAVPGNASVEVE